MKWWAIKVCVALLTGVIVTWAVAWAIPLWMRESPSIRSSGGDRALQPWPAFTPAQWREVKDFVSQPIEEDIYRSESRFQTYESWTAWAPEGERHANRSSFGWPARAMSAIRVTLNKAVRSREDARRRFTASHLASAGSAPTVLVNTWRPVPSWFRDKPFDFRPGVPTAILPLGFAINTAVVTGLVLLITHIPGASRRCVRRWHGRCTSCGYDRCGLQRGARCPECGRV